ncbi:lutropin-choriogonadotropic hormone receptor-like isoform X1 [Entelurus aequoreus]|uniref:lutropin-choriogonadotropic hormone receptor-like isoform X1 n=2 Tax=Entelurus aequoreus TaxID=161455 RepID=UPI002B1E5A0E|nr:lutropin-choriogonadotropic hormone receptor-like isoform X1 [Entelurus aequoreus]
MTSQVFGVMVMLFGILNVTSLEAFRCPEICCCTAFSFQCSNFTQLTTKNQTSFGSILEVRYLDLKEVPAHAFSGLSGIKKILVSYSKHVTQIRTQAFFFIRDLNEIIVEGLKNLRTIEKGAFTELPYLEYLRIYNTGLMHLPDLSTISFVGIVFFLSIEDNMAITSVPANSFCGISKMILDINLVSCGIKEVNPFAFNGTNLGRLDLSHNRCLRKLPEDAFRGATGPMYLDVSSTALSLLPQTGLQQVKQLKATSAFALKRLPPLDTLAKLEKADITYPSHCCAFNAWYIKRREEAMKKPLSPFCKTIQQLLKESKVYHHHPELQDLCPTYPDFQCTPQPDAFNPCEDLLGPNLGRFTWTIAIFTVSGNISVLMHLLVTRRKLTISQFLICNLALADLCMGFYLMLIAFKDCDSRLEYYNYATDWQMGPGCGVAGFLTMFSCELSVYTLTVIGVERCYTIVNALDLNKRLCMHHVATTMLAGWVFSLLVALLPLLGVSSYSKVSICLPMDIDTWASQAYVVIVLSLNVLAFLLVCCCYGCIYQNVCKPEPIHRSSDTKLAKRMAVLIFTDFLCKAPISFFAISASVHMPLITVSHAKIVLVIFHPINSFCNPFLYTIFTRGFRKETGRLLHRCGGALTVFKSHRPQLRSDQRANIAKPESKV